MLGSPGFGLPWPQVSLGHVIFFESTIAPCHAESVEYSFACLSSSSRGERTEHSTASVLATTRAVQLPVKEKVVSGHECEESKAVLITSF